MTYMARTSARTLPHLAVFGGYARSSLPRSCGSCPFSVRFATRQRTWERSVRCFFGRVSSLGFDACSRCLMTSNGPQGRRGVLIGPGVERMDLHLP